MSFNPFSENIIFMDGEFSTLDTTQGDLLSVGLVKYTGEELYIEIEYEGQVHPWVEKNVLPQLTGKKISQDRARQLLTEFIGSNSPYCIAYVNQFDSIFWYKLFGSPKEHPFFWIPIDFAAILFGYGYDPESFNKHRFFDMLGIKRGDYGFHNALEDARLLAHTYKNFFQLVREHPHL